MVAGTGDTTCLIRSQASVAESNPRCASGKSLIWLRIETGPDDSPQQIPQQLTSPATYVQP